jgi:hypothetical protein
LCFGVPHFRQAKQEQSTKYKEQSSSFRLHPSAFILPPSSFRPSSFRPSSFILPSLPVVSKLKCPVLLASEMSGLG